MTETSTELHSTFFTLFLWWSDVNIFICFEMSQILTVESVEPDAKTDKLEWLREIVNTESVWLPCLNFLFELLNFLGFFDLDNI